MCPPFPEFAAKLGATLIAAAANKGKSFWLRNNEGARLIGRMQRRVRADASVHHEVREELAKELPQAIRTEPEVQGAIVLLLNGERVEAARGALAELVARLTRSSVKWPQGFTADQFGAIVAGHAVAAINEVKATDREAAHVDAKRTREQIEGVPDKVAQAIADSARLPLRPPFGAGADTAPLTDSASLLTMLRASERRFDLVGRDDVMKGAKAWLETPLPGVDSDHRVMIIHGPGGAGKTRLAGEILALAEADHWTAGFLTAPSPEDWDELAHPSRRLAIAIDYSEARRADLQRLFGDAPVGHHPSAPLRVLLLVREAKLQSETWARRLGGPVDLGSRGQRLLSNENVETISLVDSLPSVDDRVRLWSAAGEALGSAAEPPAYLSGRPFERPLYLLFDAHRHASKAPSGERDGVEAPTVQELLQEVLNHERNYWVKARSELEVDLDEIRMNQVAVVATLVGGADRRTFESTLSALPWLAEDDELRRRVVGWWGAVYATSNDTVRGVEPDPVGEFLVVKALGEPASFQDNLGGVMPVARVTELVASATLPARQRILRFLTMVARNEDFDGSGIARTALGEILGRHLDELLPSAFGSIGDEIEHGGAMGEPLATTVAAAAVAANALSLLAPGSGETDMLEPGGQDGSEDMVRNAALQLIRREVERIAAQELEAGAWPLDRYLEIAQWAVMLDLRSGNAMRAAQSIVEIAGLEPPRRQLALLFLELGRHHAEHRRYGEAEEAFGQALEELDVAGEADTTLAYVIWHDRGMAASKRVDLDTSVEYYERAVEGKKRLLGPAHHDTITSALALSYVVAMRDLERAFRLLDETAEAVAGSPDDLVERVRGFRPRLPFAAARFAEAEKRWDDAERLYRQALEQLGAYDDEDARYAEHVVQHDLGDVAAERGDHETAVDWFEKAFAGKEAMRGVAHSGTIVTLERLAQEIAKDNVDKALERLGEARAQLEQSGGAHGDLLVALGEEEVTVLANAGRFDQATAVTRRIQGAQMDVFVRRAILESNGDQATSDEAVTSVAILASVLASRVFASGDMRQAALASRLSEVISQTIGSLIIAQMSESATDNLLRAGDSDEWALGVWSARPKSQDEFETVFRKMASAVPNYIDFVSEGIDLLTAAIERALEDPVISSLSSASAPGSHAPVDDRATRSWLARTMFAGGDEESHKQATSSLLVFYVHLRLKGAPPTIQELASSTVLFTPDGEEVVRAEQAQLVEELQEAGGMDGDRAERLVAAARARAAHRAGRALHAKKSLEDCEGFYRQALDEMKAIGEDKSVVGYAIRHELGEVAAQRGDSEAALRHFEAALAGRTEIHGLASEITLTTLGGITEEIAKEDVDKALERLGDARRQLEADGDKAGHVEWIRQHEVVLLRDADRLEEASVVARAAVEMRTRRGLRDAFRDVIADPVAVEGTPTSLAVVMCLIAARILPASDPRLAPLASRLTDIVTGAVGLFMVPYVQTSVLGQLAAFGHGRRPGAEVAAAARRIDGLPPEVKDALGSASRGSGDKLVESAEIVEAAAREILGEPEFSSLLAEGVEVAPRTLMDNQAVRRWLARTVYASADDEEGYERNVAYLLTLYLGLRLDLAKDVHIEKAFPAIWCSPEVDAAVEAEAPLLVEDLVSAGRSEESDMRLFLDAAKAHAMFVAARDLEVQKQWPEARSMYERTLGELTKLGKQNTLFGYVIQHDLGDVAVARGDLESAEGHLERALEGKIDVFPDRWDPQIVVTLQRLIDVLREREPEVARQRLEMAISEASEAGAEAQVEVMRKQLRAWGADESDDAADASASSA